MNARVRRRAWRQLLASGFIVQAARLTLRQPGDALNTAELRLRPVAGQTFVRPAAPAA